MSEQKQDDDGPRRVTSFPGSRSSSGELFDSPRGLPRPPRPPLIIENSIEVVSEKGSGKSSGSIPPVEERSSDNILLVEE